MSEIPVFAKDIRVGDLVWHSIAKSWLPLAEVNIVDGTVVGWVRDENIGGTRGWIPRIADNELVMVQR